MSHDVLDIDIAILDERWEGFFTPEILQVKTQTWLNGAINHLNPQFKKAEVSIALMNDSEIKILNHQYRQIDQPTNVLSFSQFDPSSPSVKMDTGQALLLGDIILSLDTLQREASEQNKNLEHHTAHMMVHGFLHLMGYDHMIEDEAEIMEALEIKILKDMGISNPYEQAIE